eukprot:EG_transcript_40875
MYQFGFSLQITSEHNVDRCRWQQRHVRYILPCHQIGCHRKAMGHEREIQARKREQFPMGGGKPANSAGPLVCGGVRRCQSARECRAVLEGQDSPHPPFKIAP